MHILFDHQIFSYQDFGGVSRVFYEIITRLPKDDWDISVKYSNNYFIDELKKIKHIPSKQFFPNRYFYKKQRLMLELGKLYSLQSIKKNDFDVLHLTHYESYAINATKKPIVMTYHDKLFSSYALNPRTVREQKKCLTRVNSVVCVSENTKKDFLSLFNYPEEKTFVIPNGKNSLPKVIFDENKKKQSHYILFVGGRQLYKNFENFVIGISSVMRKDRSLRLICTGVPFSKSEKELLAKYDILKRTFIKYVSDYELGELYTYAECFVFPSKYEGFGLPLLEAMDCNCPICCSDASCFPEIAGEAAEYFDPNNPDSIAQAVENVIYDAERRDSLIRTGEKRAALYTWDKSVERYIELYKNLIQETI